LAVDSDFGLQFDRLNYVTIRSDAGNIARSPLLHLYFIKVFQQNEGRVENKTQYCFWNFRKIPLAMALPENQ